MEDRTKGKTETNVENIEIKKTTENDANIGFETTIESPNSFEPNEIIKPVLNTQNE